MGADLVVDEITAHARAACEIDPEVDTIIEIGGQDSKFTTLKNGAVTFSVMNKVCAAGTGSFIEEQARKLGCPLADYSARVEHRPSPMASDRCTVFMERDINHYLSEGYTVDEVLAAVLHSVRENYLTKVAVEAGIGNTISFQGATAKNRALVAAFEQRLNKPIHVSRYCHLTGALGRGPHPCRISPSGRPPSGESICSAGEIPLSLGGLRHLHQPLQAHTGQRGRGDGRVRVSLWKGLRDQETCGSQPLRIRSGQGEEKGLCDSSLQEGARTTSRR